MDKTEPVNRQAGRLGFAFARTVRGANPLPMKSAPCFRDDEGEFHFFSCRTGLRPCNLKSDKTDRT